MDRPRRGRPGDRGGTRRRAGRPLERGPRAVGGRARAARPRAVARHRRATGSRRAGVSSRSSSSRRSRWVARSGLELGGTGLGAAARASRELIERSPFREAGHRLLMEALAGDGNVAEALRAYDALRVLLRDELGTSPAADVQALHMRLLAGEGAGRAPRAGRAGRERCPAPLALTLAAAVRRARRASSRRCGRSCRGTRAPGAGPCWSAARRARARAASCASSPPRRPPAACSSSTAPATRWSARPTGRSSRRSTT